MRELLIGYLLDALEPEERARVEALLASDPALRAELAELRALVLPLDEDPEHLDPPTGLAERTCDRVLAACHDADDAKGDDLPGNHLPMPARHDHAERRHGWRLHDSLVATGITVAAALMVFPALEHSRTGAEIAACANNLRQIGYALAGYSDFHRGFFPSAPAGARYAGAGVYAPMLVEAGFLSEPRAVLCPGSAMARQPGFSLPTLAELQQASGADLDALKQRMGGAYGYSLGHYEAGRLQPTRNRHREDFAVAADAPSLHLAGFQSNNHRGQGQNVLFEAGNVAFWKTPRPHPQADALFVNEEGYVDAGAGPDDAVLGASHAAPCPQPVQPPSGDGF
jgi:hypothetical protein